MEGTWTWLKGNWLKIVVVAVPALAAMIGLTVAFKPAPAGTDPQIVFYIPGLEAEPLIQQAVPGVANEGARDRHPLLNVARRLAGQQYARQNGLTREQGRALAFAIPTEMIEERIAQDKVMFGDVKLSGVPISGGPLIDWLKAHPEFLTQLIQLLLVLIPLFAQADDPAIFPDWRETWHAQLAYPPTPSYSLAA